MSTRDKVFQGIVLILFGIFIPWLKGLMFFDLFMLAPYSLLGFLFLSPKVVEKVFAGNGEIELPDLAKSIGYGWGCAMGMIITGIIAVNLRIPHRTTPPIAELFSLAILSLLLSIIVGALSAVVAQKSYDSSQAKGRLRIGFLIMLCILFGAPHILSDEFQDQILSLTMANTLAWFTLISAPILALAAVGSVLWAVRRGKLKSS